MLIRPGRWRPGADRRAVRHPGQPGAARVPGRSAIVVGGGIAGLAAATVLAERGVAVTLLEREASLGGRVRSWPVDLPAGAPMSRGFHAFFRQYYQLRALLRRADPELCGLRPVADYPLARRDGPGDSFAQLPKTPPWNLIGFVLRSPSFTLGDLARVDARAALDLLRVRYPSAREEYAGTSAAQVLDALRFPDACRHLALEVFARSFFADPDEFSGVELVNMFHLYFLGSAEGLLFDVAADDFDTALWRPLARYLSGLGVDIRTDTAARGIDAACPAVLTDAGALTADALVLATDRRPLQDLIAASDLGDPAWRAEIAGLRSAPPFVVWRLWLDRPPRPGSPDFLGTSGFGPLDNVSMVHQFEDSARRWALANGGSVVELHAYAVADPDERALRRELKRQLDALHPELADAGVLGEQWLVRDDCPLVDVSGWRAQPGIDTPQDNVVLAGDGIRCDLPIALMERAATTGMIAANRLLARWGGRGADIWTAPMRGLLG